jgi:tetratricopeptide (TPR) repeat protein
VPAAAAIAVALELSKFGSGGEADTAPAPLACMARGMFVGAVLAAVAFGTALLHGLLVGFCDLGGGSLFFWLTAGMGALLGGAWGACVAEMIRERRRRRLLAVLFALAAPLAGIVVSVVRFYTSPMIFAYDPFFGYFSGALYDTVVDVRTELWTYRGGTLCTLVGLLLVASAVERGGAASISAARLRLAAPRPAAIVRLASGVAVLLVSLTVTAEGPRLGHWQTAGTIADALGGRRSGERCDVVFPDWLLKDQAGLLLKDCEEELRADEARLGVRLPARLTAFFFADANQKRRLMGAADTSIAKPWRREVYVQVAGYPHPVLGHEVAHVVAGSVARGPFRVAGALDGLVPNPGLIEGLAVAMSPDDDELTGAQWARAMLELGTLPDMRSLFSLRFLGVSVEKSYTVAGAFVGWVMDTWGTGVVQRWYGGASLEKLAGQSWQGLDKRFHEALASLPMPPEAMTYARARFERPSVWARKCPHIVDALDRDADRCRDEHRYDRALGTYAEVLRRDPHDWHARFERARIEAWYGDRAGGDDELMKLARSEHAPRSWRDRAEETIADLDFVEGRADAAAHAYKVIAEHTLDEDAARTLEVKALSAIDPEARRAVGALLLGQPGRPPDAWIGALDLGLWLGEEQPALAQYLAGKNLARRSEWTQAAEWLDRALAAGVPTQRIARELLRERTVCACALNDRATLGVLEEAVAAQDSPFAGSRGRRQWLLALITRCRTT